MQLVIGLLKETIDALERKHFLTAGELARATYFIAMIKSNNGQLLHSLASIDHLCARGAFDKAHEKAVQIYNTLEAIV